MTNSTDEFDQDDQFDPMDVAPEEMDDVYGEEKQSLVDKLRNNPIVKLVIIMSVIGVALAGALGAFSSNDKEVISRVMRAPGLNEAPGGASSQFFNEQNTMANEQRVEEALQQGGSAMPTPTGRDVSSLVPPEPDPMLEFKAETERLRKELQAEQAQNAIKIESMQRQVTQEILKPEPEDDSLAKAMQKQMEDLMASWVPRSGQMIKGVAKPTDMEAQQVAQQQASQEAASEYQEEAEPLRILVPAGTVNYMQLLTEANSDVQGPILAQILSGPFSGGRAIGRFEVRNDYLVLGFSQVSYKGKEYSIQGLALDPDTTLGGMATDVDHRYFTRIVLPAAGAFMAAFGSAMAETDVETETTSGGGVTQDQAAKGFDEAIYAGVGAIGQSVAGFFNEEAANTKTLVRVEVGTPLGLFFLTKVMEQE